MHRRSLLVSGSVAAVGTGVGQVVAAPNAAAGPIAAGPVPAAPTNPAGTAPTIAVRTDLAAVARTVDGITLDGALGDSRWGEAVWTRFTTLYDLSPADGVTAHLCHDTTTLYVGVRITGARAAVASQLSLIIRTGLTGPYRAVTLQLRADTPKPSFTWGGTTTAITGHTSKFRVADDVTTAELAVPLAQLGVTGDPAGALLGVTVVLDHQDLTLGTVTSVPTRTSVNSYQGGAGAPIQTAIVDESRTAPVHLGRVPAFAAGRPAPAIAAPEVVLGYLDHTRSSLRVDLPGSVADQVSVSWRGPGEDRTPLELAVAKPIRGGFTTTVTHPAATTAGQYELRIEMRSRTGQDRLVVVVFDRDALINAGNQLPANAPHPPQQSRTVTAAPASAEVTALLALVPDRTGFTFCGVPDKPELHPNATYTWSPDRPDKIVAISTGTAYPNSDYPEDRALTVTNRLGQQVSYPYHEDASGKRYFLSGHLWYQQRNHVYGQLPDLASRDPLGAARVLHKFAQVYQGWVPTNEYPWFNRPVQPSATPRNFYWGGVWYRWSIADLGAMSQIGAALEQVLQTDAFEVLSREVGHDVRSLLLDRTIAPSLDWYRSHVRLYTNNDYPGFVGMASLGRALGDSALIHETVEWAVEYLRRGFLFDGFWKETTLSYHLQSINGLYAVALKVAGWSDAPGYQSPRSGRRFDNLDLLSDMAVLGASQRLPNQLAYPDAKLFPMADTWAYALASAPDRTVGSLLVPAAGVARLSRGRIPSGGHPGVKLPFLDLAITAQSVPTTPFPASGTVQFEATSAGQTITFAFPVGKADEYDIDLQPFRAGSYGRYEVAVDDRVLGEIDFYSTASGVAGWLTLGRMQLSAGDHSLRFRGLGKNDASSNYKMGLTTLALLDAAARQERDTAEPPESVNPSQAYLQFTPKYGHNHLDPLSLALWAEGQELLPDLGYSHTRYRAWSVSTLGHNTVTVDSSDMKVATGADGGSVEVFDHLSEPVQVTRAEFGTAYPQTSRYQREVWSIELPGSQRHAGYLLDLFRVVGGKRHEFSLNGDANRDATMTAAVPMTTYEDGKYLLPAGTTVVEPATEVESGTAQGHYYGYIFVRNVTTATLTDGRYDVTLATTLKGGAPGSKARILGQVTSGAAGDVATQLFLGTSPSFRATRVDGASGDTNDQVVKWSLPKLVLRRDGNDLRSNFVTVVEPYAGTATPQIAAVEALPHNGTADDLAVKVTHADGTVDIVLSRQNDSGSLSAGGVTLTGKLGWARISGTTTTGLHLVGGTRITAPGRELTGTGAVIGTVTGTRRTIAGDPVDALVTTASVPDWVVGHTVVVTHPGGKTHGYPIKQVTVDNGATLIELAATDPGFTVDGNRSAMVFTPFTTWTGATTFRIENSSHAG